ncbi:MAG: HAMP domain-containing protein, partial [Ferruginibacter sp.]
MLIHIILMTLFVLGIEKEQGINLYTKNHKETAILANIVAVNAAYKILANDNQGVQATIKSIENFPGIQYAMIVSADNVVLAHTQQNLIGEKIFIVSKDSMNILQKINELSGDSTTHNIVSPIINANKQIIGWVQIVSHDNNIFYQITAITRMGIVYILLVFVAVFLIALFISKYLTRDLHKLLDVVTEVRAGKHYVRATASDTFEINALATGINKMLDEIEEKKGQLLLTSHLPDIW